VYKFYFRNKKLIEKHNYLFANIENAQELLEEEGYWGRIKAIFIWIGKEKVSLSPETVSFKVLPSFQK